MQLFFVILAIKFFIANITFLVIVCLFGCNKAEKDEQAPFIKINLPENHDNFIRDNLLTYDLEFSDDFQLKSYKINIHSASIPILKQTNYIWDTTINSSISGINYIIKKSFSIPLNVDTGNYLFIVTCSDKAGNEDWVARDFTIH